MVVSMCEGLYNTKLKLLLSFRRLDICYLSTNQLRTTYKAAIYTNHTEEITLWGSEKWKNKLQRKVEENRF